MEGILANSECQRARRRTNRSQLSGERAELQRQLLLQLASPKSKHTRSSRVFWVVRMEGATRDLASVITLEAEARYIRGKRYGIFTPQVEALARIGSPPYR